MTPRPMGLRSWSDAEPIESADLREQPACGHEEILRRFILHGSAIFVSGPDVWASLRVFQQASRPSQGAVVGHDRIRHLVQASGGRMLLSAGTSKGNGCGHLSGNTRAGRNLGHLALLCLVVSAEFQVACTV